MATARGIIRFAAALVLAALAVPTFACSCTDAERILEGLEGRNELFKDRPLPSDIFHGRVVRLLSAHEADVEVLESFVGEGGTRRLSALATNEGACGTSFKLGEEFIYRLGTAKTVALCSKWFANRSYLDRLRAMGPWLRAAR